MAGSGFDHPTSAQTMRISTISANGGFEESARVLLYEPSFICALKKGQTGAGTENEAVEPWAVCRGGETMIWAIFPEGPDFHFVRLGQVLYGFSTTRRHKSNGAAHFVIRGLQFSAISRLGRYKGVIPHFVLVLSFCHLMKAGPPHY